MKKTSEQRAMGGIRSSWAAKTFNSKICVLALAAAICATALAQAKLVREFKKGSLGLFDVSSDGALLAFNQVLDERVKCVGTPCDQRVHQVVVKESGTGQTVGTIKLAFSGFRKRVIAFVPNTREVLVRGRIVGPNPCNGFLVWNPSTGEVSGAKAIPETFEFLRFIDATRILGVGGRTEIMQY